jgi:hypothetical protein
MEKKKKKTGTISKPRNAVLLTIQPFDAADSQRTFYYTSYIFSHKPKDANL